MTTTTTAAIVREDALLTAFWQASSDIGARLELVKQLAVIRVQTPADWSPARTREAFVAPARPVTGCFICLCQNRQLAWHHLIAVANGGSNSRLNLISICNRCHQRIHPWLPDEPLAGKWTGVAELAKALLDTERERE